MIVEKLVYMANQIGKFFAAQGEGAVVDGVAEHLEKYWDPRMRAALGAHVVAGGAGLDARVREAVERVTSRSGA